MDGHDKRLDRLESAVTEGFENVNRKLDALAASESERRGASRITRGIFRILFGVGGAGGLWELAKEFFHK